MSLDDTLKVVDVVKWPIVLFAFLLVALFALRTEVRGLVSGIRSRGIRFGDTEATPEQDNQIAQVKPPPAPRLSAENPHPFELSDNPYFRGQVQALTQRVSNIEFASQEEKLRWLMREGAGLVVRLDFEKLYPVIWASQMELLGAANRTGGITRGHAIEHYAKIKELNPKVYDRYTYDQWIGFLTSSGLLAVSGDQFSTTDKAKLFIQYLVAEGYNLHGLYRDR